MITQKDVLEFVNEQPFRPFRIHLSDGSHRDVNHPELVKVSPRKVMVFVPIPKLGAAAIDDYVSLSLLHITQLEPLSTPSKSRKS